MLRYLHTLFIFCNWLCVLFQITSWPAVPTPKECGKSSLTARAVRLGSRGVLPTPCFTWCGLALYFFVSVIRYEIRKSICTRFDIHWCTTFSKAVTLTALSNHSYKCLILSVIFFSVKSDLLSEVGSVGSPWDIWIFPLWLISFGFLCYEGRRTDIFVPKECTNVLLQNIIIVQL